jgi:predicted phage terminase large subunit-like protein
MAATTTEIRPQPGPQELFLKTPADIAIYGGAAGGGKSWALLLEPLRHVNNPDFGAVIFRRTFPQIKNEGALWDESGKVYPLLGAKARETTLEYEFPRGARVRFAHMQYEGNKLDWQGAQIPLLGFDELTHFSESMFFYMLSRNRSMCGVRPYVRATTNPDADSWVAEFISWWIDQDTGYPIPERAGRLRWFVRLNEELIWADTAGELTAKHGPAMAPKSLTFIPAKLTDNPALMQRDPGYMANLLALPLVDRERLLGGNWKIRAAAGKVFNRAWFGIVDAVPAGGLECRFWDFASTAKELAKDDPDFTAGVKIRQVDGVYYVTDVYAEQVGPTEAETQLVNVTKQDMAAARETGTRYMVRWEMEPGAAAVRYSRLLVGMVAGADAQGVRSSSDKLVRAKPLGSQALAGNVKLLRGRWNEAFLRHMHGQPDLPHDDIMDATAGAFNELVRGPGKRAAGSHQG